MGARSAVGRSLMTIPCPPIAFADPGSTSAVYRWGQHSDSQMIFHTHCDASGDAEFESVITSIQPVEGTKPLRPRH